MLFDKRSEPEEESKFNTVFTKDGRPINIAKLDDEPISSLIEAGGRWARVNYPIVSQHPSDTRSANFSYRGASKTCGPNKQWRFGLDKGLPRLARSNRIFDGGRASLGGVAFWDDWDRVGKSNLWTDMHGEKFPIYVVQTTEKAIERCLLMTTDPGDLVLDPTCGSGTTASVAEKWGRRWITCDTSRVAVTLAKQRLVTASFDYYQMRYPHEGLKGGFVLSTPVGN